MLFYVICDESCVLKTIINIMVYDIVLEFFVFHIFLHGR